MSADRNKKPEGVLRPGWNAEVGDYATVGGWVIGGKSMVVGDAAGGVYAFEGTSGTGVWARDGAHAGGVLAMAIHPSGAAFATAGEDGRVVIWDAGQGQIAKAIDVGRGWVEHLAWSPDGAWLAVAHSRQVHVYDVVGTHAWRSDDHPSTVSAIAWSAEELASACYGRVSFFDASTGERRQKLEWKGSLVSMVLSADGDIVACGSQDNTVHFWRRSTGKDSMMAGYPAKPSTLAFDATSTLLATSGGSGVTVWSFDGNGPEGTKPGVMDGHTKLVTTLAFARRGLRLASGGREGMVIVWSLKSDAQGGPIGAAMVGGVVAEVHWRPDGRALAALDAQGGVTVWRVG